MIQDASYNVGAMDFNCWRAHFVILILQLLLTDLFVKATKLSNQLKGQHLTISGLPV